MVINRRGAVGAKPLPVHDHGGRIRGVRDNVDLLPSPKEIAGIEVYNGAATIPLKYKSRSVGFCGLILIWLRDGP